MPQHGGKREGAGRKPGSVVSKTRKVAVELAVEGQMPLEYVVAVMRDPNADERRRDWAAEKAMPYMHARLASDDQGRALAPAHALQQPVDQFPLAGPAPECRRALGGHRRRSVMTREVTRECPGCDGGRVRPECRCG